MKKTKKKSVSPRADRQACCNRSTSSDVTERRQVEAAWRDSEARFRAVAENTPDHVLVQDKDLRYRLVVNPQMGFTEQQLLGTTDHDLIPPNDAAVLTRLKRRVLKTGKAVHVQLPVT